MTMTRSPSTRVRATERRSRLPLVVVEGSPAARGLRGAVALLVVLAVVLLPETVGAFRLDQVTNALIIAIAVVGLNLLSGFGGQISLGHAAFFGIGAYSVGILTTRSDTPFVVALLGGMVLCFVVGVLVGLPALRLHGMYLALVTLAVGVLFPSLVRRFSDLTGGSAGLFGITFDPPPSLGYFAGRAGDTLWLYWVTVVAVGLSCLLVRNLMRSRVGRAVVSLRDNETVAVVMGVDRAMTRTVLFGLSGAIAGLAGGLFAAKSGIITPDGFSLVFTIHLLVGMVLGGRASFWGPILGGFAVYFIPVWTSDVGGGPIAGVLFGAVVIAMVFLLPTGLAGALRRLTGRLLVIRPRPEPAVPDDSGSGGRTDADPPR
jgi:branched-chain amino acid transport system permease protein